MRKLLFTLCLGMMILHHAKAQREGDTWMFGYYESENHPNFSIIHLDFNSGNLQLSYDRNEVFRFSETSANICDTEGLPLLWTNGMTVRGRSNNDVIDTIAYEGGSNSYWQFHFNEPKGLTGGFSLTDGAVILPIPTYEDEYYVAYHMARRNFSFYEIDRWVYARLKFEEDGSFEIAFKDSLILPGLEWFSRSITAVRHANGRDWWLIVFEKDSRKYYSLLADSYGISLRTTGDSGSNSNSGHGQVVVSPNGEFLARTETGNINEGQMLTVFSLDRCSGSIQLLDSIHMGFGNSWQGTAFSPSNRYLYVTTKRQLWRFDLAASDIEASIELVGEYDGFIEPIGAQSTVFGPLMQTPDSRIYIVPPAGGSQFLHVIDRPNLPSNEIRFLQHHISLIVNNGRSSPNIPNFRLGPLDGSPCDTLGLDNLAASRWRHEPDIDYLPLAVRFTDLSFYEPTSWHWDFGDGQTSEEVNPIHTYEDYGFYHVCQTVSNEFTQDSTCQWVEVVPYTSIDDPLAASDLYLSPNPFTDQLRIESQSGRFRSADVNLFDLQGQLVFASGEIPVPVTMRVPDFPAGMYICRIEEMDGKVTILKVVKQ